MSEPQPKTMERGLHYRADIDGLRAIAVLSVFAYHLRTELFRGGYVGVDVFFVISGYLISGIIMKDITAGKFSIASFYERRIRRIFPALAVTLLGSAVLAYLCLLPAELVDFSKSLLAALFSASNFYFWKHSGYFSAPAETTPLIHTWSLAVEEQFYIFLPIFLVLAYRYFPRKLRLSVAVIAGASFVLSAVGVVWHPTAAFYLAPTRAWELLLGVLISLDAFPDVRGEFARSAVALCGIGLISFAVFDFAPTTPFPGLAALVPCGGTALVLAAGRSGSSHIARALSFKPLAFVGLISYSLYLWHWPIIVFQGMESVLIKGVSIHMAKLMCIAVSFVVATLSWKYVEQPFRTKRKDVAHAGVFKAASVTAALVAAVGLVGLTTRGLPLRYPVNALGVASYLNYDASEYVRDGSCFISSGYAMSDFDMVKCLRQDPSKKNFLLLGDSHAAHLWYGLSNTLRAANILQATASGCRPTIEQPVLAGTTCKTLMHFIYASYLPANHVDRLILAARWKDEDLPSLASTLDQTNARRISVLLSGPMVQYDTPLPRLLAFSIRDGNSRLPYEHRFDQHKLDDAMAVLAAKKGVDYVSFYRLLCGAQSCAELDADGVPLQFDYGHLTKQGSLFVAHRLVENGAFQPPGSPQEVVSDESKPE